MNLTNDQSKLVELTLKLDLKAREYKQLCNQFEKLKEKEIDTNSAEYIELKKSFVDNQKEISEIYAELKKLQESNR